jgi:SAM-dependent methyltransferase
MSQSLTYRDCPSCQSDLVKDLTAFARENWRIGACQVCDFVFLRNPVEYEALEEVFAWEKTYAAEGATRQKRRSLLKRMAYSARVLGYRIRGDLMPSYLRLLGPGLILDIGCGDVVRWRAPFIPWGIEISKVLQQRADAKMRPLGGECVQGAGADAIWTFPENHFDSVMMHSYLEHEVQFAKLLTGIQRCLKPGGKAYVRVPNYAALNRHISGANWPGFRYPDHVNYFTAATLKKVAQDAGFEFKLVNRPIIWVDDNIKALLIKPETA